MEKIEQNEKETELFNRDNMQCFSRLGNKSKEKNKKTNVTKDKRGEILPEDCLFDILNAIN